MNLGLKNQFKELRKVFLNENKDISLEARFRALFSLKTLGKQGYKEAIDILAEGFCDDSELLKHEIAYVLGQTRNKEAIIPLENVLKDKMQESMVRHEAAEALGALGNQESLPLLDFFQKNDPSEVIRQTCELAIERIKWENSNESKIEGIHSSIFESIDPAPALPPNPHISIEKELEGLKKELVDQNLPIFYRYRVMFRLRNIGTNAAIEILSEGFKDPSALFRHEIAYIFGQLCSPHAIPSLTNILCNQSEESMVRHEAAEALGSIGIPDIQQLLKTFIKDKERVVRESCIIALDMCNYEQDHHQQKEIQAR